MDLGHCPRCLTPYSPSEVTGFGVLRGRSAQNGGPRVEYSCPACGRLIHLIAHGEGRYAPPGHPPPAAVSAEERAPPWIRDTWQASDPEASPPRREPPPAQEAPPEVERPPRREPEPEPPPPDRESVPPEAGISPVDALALLGVTAAADREAIERAFRERSLTCHPDKVAHLDADFVALAERKFLRLRQAYDLLTG